MEERADHIAEWFQSLRAEEMPDVVVFNEVYSYSAEKMLQKLACKKWSKNRPLGQEQTFLPCDPDSMFQAATRVVNATYLMNPIKEGGVVILTRRGIEMRSAHERVFAAASGSDGLSKKGFWAVEAVKGSQTYWVLGTHTQAHQGADKALVRVAQFRQMRAFVDEVVPDGGRVCFAGDMNTSMQDEDVEMLKAFGTAGAPATVGDLIPRGFWIPMEEDLVVSLDAERNHLVACNPKEFSQRLDWVISPGANDRLATPVAMRYQYVPVKANSYMPSECVPGTECDDLSDHYGVFTQMWYGAGECPEVKPVEGHRGVCGNAGGKLLCELQEKVLQAIGKTAKPAAEPLPPS